MAQQLWLIIILQQTCLLLLFFTQLSSSIGTISPVHELQASTLQQGQQSILLFYFSVETAIEKDNYIKIEMNNYQALTPRTCSIKQGQMALWKKASCTAQASYLFIKLPDPLWNNVTSNALQIELDEANPRGSVSNLFAIWTVSSEDPSNYFVYDFNPNFGQVPFMPPNKNNGASLTASVVSFGTALTKDRPNAVNSFTINVKINQAVGDEQLQRARVKIVVSSPWLFPPTCTVSAGKDPRFDILPSSDPATTLYASPLLDSFTIESPNQISVLFSEAFPEGRAFQITVSELQNPSQQANGILQLFTMDYNSNLAYESAEELLVLNIYQNPVEVLVTPGGGLPGGSGGFPVVGFYRNTKQYITVRFKTDRTVPANSTVIIDFGVNSQAVTGSAYICPLANAFDGNKPILYSYSGSQVNISNLQSIPSATEYWVSCRVLLPVADSDFAVTVSIMDPESVAVVGAFPLFQGVKQGLPLKTNARSSLILLYGSSGVNGQIDIQSGAGGSYFEMQLTLSAIQALPDSWLEIYTTRHVKMNGPIICTVNDIAGGGILNNVAMTGCSLTENADYTYIHLPSNAGTNFYGQATRTIRVSNLLFQGASTQEDYIYELFFRLHKDASPSSPCTDFMVSPFVLNQAEPSFKTISMNDLNSVLSGTGYIFPSLINMVVTSTSAFSFAITSDEVRVITVFASQGLESLVYRPQSQSSFPCGSNLVNGLGNNLGNILLCEYINGDTSSNPQNPTITDVWPLGWDRLNVFLPSSASGSTFHVLFPDLYSQPAGTLYLYAFALGTYNKLTRQYKYLKNQLVLSVPQGGMRVASSNLQQIGMTLSGFAGSQINGVKLTTASSSGHRGNDGTNFGAALIMVTDWQFWVQGESAYASGLTGPASAAGSTGENGPITLQYTDLNGAPHYVTVMPLVNVARLQASSDFIYLNGVHLPYMYDQPNLNIYITDKNGLFDSYSQFFNAGHNAFYKNSLQKVDMVCRDMSEGILNTQCSLLFTPNYPVQGKAKIYADFIGLKVYTDSCTVSYTLTGSLAPAIPVATTACQSNYQIAQLVIPLAESVNTLPGSTATYQVTFFGVEIQSVLQKSVTLSVRDQSGAFIIEQGTKVLTTAIYQKQYIAISEIVYRYVNPYVYSDLTVVFTTPRALYDNEYMAINMGKNLNDVNTNTDRLSVRLFRGGGGIEQLQVAVSFDGQKMRVQFFNRTAFSADTYRLVIYNILNPAANDNEYFQIQFVRTYDAAQVLSNVASTTVAFPKLVEKTNSNITVLDTNYLLEGGLSEISFRIQMQKSRVTSTSVIYVNFPLYYTPSVTNNQDHLFCKLNNIKVSCYRSLTNQFRLVVSNSPLEISVGESFILTVFGVLNPQFSQRFNPLYTNETMFVAVDSGLPDRYAEFMHFKPPEVQSIATVTGYLYLHYVDVSVKFTGHLSKHKIKIFTDVALPASSVMQFIFPREYVTMVITQSLICHMGTVVAQCPVDGRKVEVVLTESLQAQSYFIITFEDVPTPIYEQDVDMNQIVMEVADISRRNVLARNFYLTNRMHPVRFTKLQNVLKVNEDNFIYVTKGTYSQPISIKTADNSRFISNLLIGAAATGFTFDPEQMSIFLGDYGTQFRVGANKNLMEKAYGFSIQMMEKSSNPVYSVASSMVLFVVSLPLTINIPATRPANIRIPRGGCSLFKKIQLSNSPTQSIDLMIQYDYQQYPEELFRVDLELSSYVLSYNKDVLYRYMAFCISRDFPTGQTEMHLDVVITGPNAPSYQLSAPYLLIDIIDKVVPTTPIAFTVLEDLVTRTSFRANISVNVDGTLYWHVFPKSSSWGSGSQKTIDPLSLVKIKLQIKDHMLQLSSDMTDNQVGMQVFYTAENGTIFNQLLLKDLKPETNYSLCAYLEDEFKNNTGQLPLCQDFKTSAWQDFTKFSLVFSKKTYKDSLNDLLCFFVRQIQTRIFYLVDSQGLSCSFNIEPSDLQFSFYGDTVTTAEWQTNLYLIPDLNVESDPSIAILQGLFDGSQNLKSTVKDNAAANFSIDFLQSGKYISQFKYSVAIAAQNEFAFPSVKSLSYASYVTQYNASIIVKDLTLSKEGVVYFILQRTKQFVQDHINQQLVDIPLTIVKKPTSQQILNCRNHRDVFIELCKRAIITSASKSLDIEFSGLLFMSEYKLYYVVGNEFPLQPILNEDIQEADITIGYAAGTFSEILKYSFIIIISLLLIFIAY